MGVKMKKRNKDEEPKITEQIPTYLRPEGPSQVPQVQAA